MSRLTLSCAMFPDWRDGSCIVSRDVDDEILPTSVSTSNMERASVIAESLHNREKVIARGHILLTRTKEHEPDFLIIDS